MTLLILPLDLAIVLAGAVVLLAGAIASLLSRGAVHPAAVAGVVLVAVVAILLATVASLRPADRWILTGLAFASVFLALVVLLPRTMISLSGLVDWFNARFGAIANWCILISCLISAGNAMVRYGIGASSNAWLEIQWYLFSAAFLLGASYTLKVNEHVRVDIVYALVGDRGRLWIDLIGLTLFLLPATVILAWMTWPFFLEAYQRGEVSGNAGGLIRWPVKIMLPLGFAMLTLQGLSEIIKRVAGLLGQYRVETRYEKPLQ